MLVESAVVGRPSEVGRRPGIRRTITRFRERLFYGMGWEFLSASAEREGGRGGEWGSVEPLRATNSVPFLPGGGEGPDLGGPIPTQEHRKKTRPNQMRSLKVLKEKRSESVVP